MKMSLPSSEELSFSTVSGALQCVLLLGHLQDFFVTSCFRFNYARTHKATEASSNRRFITQ